MIRSLTLFTCLLLSFNLFSQKKFEQKLDSVFSIMNTQNQFSGTVLIAEGGKIIFTKGYGYQDLQLTNKNTSETIYELASCSKQFTAGAISLLHRAGKLRYEDSLSKFIPELARWGKVTIYDLLRHTSGIPEYLIDMSASWNHNKIATNDDLINFYASERICSCLYQAVDTIIAIQIMHS